MLNANQSFSSLFDSLSHEFRFIIGNGGINSEILQEDSEKFHEEKFSFKNTFIVFGSICFALILMFHL